MRKAPSRGDIIVMDFDPQAGHEQMKRRPALVISDTRFNLLGLAVVCPITSTKAQHGFHITLPKSMKTKDVVMCEQLKSLDYRARKAQFVETSSLHILHQVLGVVAQFI